MDKLSSKKNLRILIVDDNRAIHEDFNKILKPSITEAGELAKMEAALLGRPLPATGEEPYEIDSAYQGEEGLISVQQSVAEGRPYAMAFVDVRMPPGWDGLETTARIWAVDPDIQIVICTAYSDSSWEDMIAKVGKSDRLLILKKPFDCMEVLQLANALTEKWLLLQQARLKIEDLERAMTALQEREALARRALEREHELHQVKSRFVTMVSHEFRTPLGVVNTAAQSLARYMDRMTVEVRSTQIQEIQSAVERMAEMMEDFLVHGEFEAGKLTCKPERVDLEALCQRSISELSSQHIECVIDPSACEVILDRKIVRLILGNLLSNAVKYSGGDQLVKLDVRRVSGHTPDQGDLATPVEDHLQLTVSDSGIGIPLSDLSKLYETFHRAGNVGQRPGTGMGLAIVKQCVDLHRGTIQIESTEGKGTSVSVRLPIAPPRVPYPHSSH